MDTETKRKAIRSTQVEEIYGISRSALAYMRFTRKGPKYFKPSPHRVIYFIDDIEDWLSRNPFFPRDSINLSESERTKKFTISEKKRKTSNV